jgi:hypothetical protein
VSFEFFLVSAFSFWVGNQSADLVGSGPSGDVLPRAAMSIDEQMKCEQRVFSSRSIQSGRLHSNE